MCGIGCTTGTDPLPPPGYSRPPQQSGDRLPRAGTLGRCHQRVSTGHRPQIELPAGAFQSGDAPRRERGSASRRTLLPAGLRTRPERSPVSVQSRTRPQMPRTLGGC